jgi:hypothetical protein
LTWVGSIQLSQGSVWPGSPQDNAPAATRTCGERSPYATARSNPAGGPFRTRAGSQYRASSREKHRAHQSLEWTDTSGIATRRPQGRPVAAMLRAVVDRTVEVVVAEIPIAS